MNLALSIPLLVLRLVTGGVFIFAAAMKLQDPQGVAGNITAFKFDIPDHLVILGSYALPWTELIIGIALVLGFWTRAAALVYALVMAIFIVGIISVIQRGLNVDCQCLGRFKLYCDGPLGTCKVVENSILLAGSLIVLTAGSGMFSLDRLIYGKKDPGLPV